MELAGGGVVQQQTERISYSALYAPCHGIESKDTIDTEMYYIIALEGDLGFTERRQTNKMYYYYCINSITWKDNKSNLYICIL